MAYTRYVLERGLAGDILDLHVALAPCAIGYAAICKRLINAPATLLKGNPYKDWIGMYAGEEYQTVAKNAALHLDTLAKSRMGQDRMVSFARRLNRQQFLRWDFGKWGYICYKKNMVESGPNIRT